MGIFNYSYNNYRFFWDTDGSNQSIRNTILTKDENGNPWDIQAQGFNAYGFQKLIDAKDYETAADYASLFHFDDPYEDNAFRADIADLRRKGRRFAAIYDKLTTKDDKDLFEFGQAVMSPRGLEELKDNDYARDFIAYKMQLGGNSKQSATKLRVAFGKARSGWIFGIGKNENTIDNLYADTGLTEADLLKSGVDVEKKGDSTYITFHKSNDLANTILANINKRGGIQSGIVGLDEHDNVIDNTVHDGGGRGRANLTNDEVTLRSMQRLIDKSKNFSDTVVEDNVSTEESTTIFGYLSSDVANLEEQLAAGKISREDFNLLIKRADDYYMTKIAQLTGSHYTIYSDWNDSKSDTMSEVTGEDKTDLINYISQHIKGGTVRLSAAINGSEVGTYITVDADPGSGSQNEGARDRVSLFIPNFLTDEVNAKINENTNSRAVLEMNDMERYNYDYELPSGNVLRPSYNNAGDFYIRRKGTPLEEAELVSRREALEEMMFGTFLEEAADKFKLAFTSADGRLIDRDRFEELVKKAVVGQVNQTYTDSEPITKEAAFDSTQYLDGKYIIDPTNTQYQKYRKVKKALQLYYEILNSVKYMENEY